MTDFYEPTGVDAIGGPISERTSFLEEQPSETVVRRQWRLA